MLMLRNYSTYCNSITLSTPICKPYCLSLDHNPNFATTNTTDQIDTDSNSTACEHATSSDQKEISNDKKTIR